MLLEKFVSVFAPERCVGCFKVGLGLCADCYNLISQPPSRCYRCHKNSLQFQVCKKCRSSVALGHLWVVCDYAGLSKKLLHNLKFERSSYLTRQIANMMAQKLPILDPDTIVCHIPTATNRVRQRGYDQAQLIAKNLAKQLNLKHGALVCRLSNSRQLGASRKVRFSQALEAFSLNVDSLDGYKILLIDDVVTSGATLETVARMIKKNGAKQVDAIVFAQAD